MTTLKDILQPPHFSASLTKSSRVHYLIPASEPSLNFCANIISALANRYPIASILCSNGKDQFDAKAGHIAKLYSIQRYFHGPAGKHEDELVIVLDGQDVLAQLPVEATMERYSERIGYHNNVLAYTFALKINEAGRKNIRPSVRFGADKACFPGLRNEPQCWAIPDSFLPYNYLNPGTIVGPLGHLRQVNEAALPLIENTWNVTSKYDLCIYPGAKGLLEAAAKAKGSLTQQMVHGRRYIPARNCPGDQLGGTFTDEKDTFVSLAAFCGRHFEHRIAEMAS